MASPAWAGEPLFGYIYTTDTLPKGKAEVEQWATLRSQKTDGGTFTQIDERTEIEYGLTDNLQVALYANATWAKAYHNGPFGETAPPEPLVYDTPAPGAHYSNSRFTGFSAEAIWRVRSPLLHKDGIGVALYVEPSYGARFREVETKLILQKNFMDDRLVVAANFTYAPEYRLLPNDDDPMRRSWQEETDTNLGIGVSYRFRPKWSAAVEMDNEREYNGLNFAKLANSAYYVGPSIHFSGRRVFATLSYLEQLPWSTVHGDSVPGAIVNGYTLDNDFERRRVRLKVGYLF
ncbi:MAG: hypothetical protein J7498_01385 [Sphingobium sp.]|nr:hypothetical protein [Sphingobium sp.]